jgi:hypothetical protein
MRRKRGTPPSHDAPILHHHPRQNRLAHRFAVVIATPVLCVAAVVAALADLRATAVVLLGSAVLIESVLTYRHRVRPRPHLVFSDRGRPVPSGLRHPAPSTTHSAAPGRPARTGPAGRSARTATPSSL